VSIAEQKQAKGNGATPPAAVTSPAPTASEGHEPPIEGEANYRAPAKTSSSPRLISQSTTGRLNRRRLLQILYDVGPSSRAELARLAEVAKTTIGSIVQPMIDDGILVEGDPLRSSIQGGKPARPIWFSPDGRPMVGVHVGPGTVRAALVSPTGVIKAEASGAFSGTTASHDAIVESVASCIRSVLPASGSAPLGIGVGVGGMVDTDLGNIVEVNLAPRLSGLDLGPRLSKEFGISVHIDLHPRVQALGDRWFGVGRNVPNFASVYCGEAIGAGFVIDGVVHRGIAGAGGEVGHTIVDLGGVVCRCGRRGCWETIATHRWLRTAAASYDLPGHRTLTVGPLLALVEDGVPGAGELFDKYARNVAVGLVNLQLTLASGLFIMHGDIVNGGERLRELIERYVLLGIAPHPRSEPRLVFSNGDGGDDITLLGAAGLVLSESLDLTV
jgi:predicted NBD/HSP70 family sugar kinase